MSVRSALTVAGIGLALVAGASPALAGKPVKCRTGCTSATPDTTPPTVRIGAPTSGSTVTGSVTVSGTAADDGVVARVEIAVDNGAWTVAGGTTSWSATLSTTPYADGSHTITARATDSAGNASTASVTVTTSNAPTATASSSPSPSPTPTASPSPSPSPSPTATTGATTSPAAPDTQGSWTSPEGVRINVNSSGSWTISQIYSILSSNALDLGLIGPTLTIEVQDSLSTQTRTGASWNGSSYSGFTATMYLQGTGSGFALRPDAELTHEYGHVWSRYYYFSRHAGTWNDFNAARWTTADGSTTLATDSRTGSSYTWQPAEIVADDYRLLFGTAAAVSQRPSHLNTSIPAPADVPGLRDWLLNSWA
jgi:hypothetical protein